ncbi:MAG: hypothetical protein FJ206_07160 [Gemmatimonadetes bacterium]|nr:hypothetical protein [Gemmatimonadota bacterium]
MRAKTQILGCGLAAMLVGGVESAQAQRVGADIHIGAGPVVGTIRIGDRPYYRSYGYYGRPRPRVVHVYPTRIAVERRHGWNPRKHRNARLVVVYYDRHCGLYFDRYRRGLEEVRVLHDNDRYFWYDDYRDRDDDRYRYDRRGRWNDRYDRYDQYDRDYRRDRDRDWDRDDRTRRDDHDGEWEHDH